MNATVSSTSDKWTSGWSGLLAIALIQAFAQMLPIVFGTGERATWDWSFLFVTFRFVVVPVLVLAYIGATLTAAAKRRRFELLAAVRCLAAAAILSLAWFCHGTSVP
jgi:hypothetical protein